MLEKEIESRVCTSAKTKGIVTYKFTSPARAAVPDRLFLANIPFFLRPVIARYVRFIEFKRGGCKPTIPQQREHQRLRDLGFVVDVIDNVSEGLKMIDIMGAKND